MALPAGLCSKVSCASSSCLWRTMYPRIASESSVNLTKDLWVLLNKKPIISKNVLEC